MAEHCPQELEQECPFTILLMCHLQDSGQQHTDALLLARQKPSLPTCQRLLPLVRDSFSLHKSLGLGFANLPV